MLACAAARVLGVGSEYIEAAVRDFDTVSGRMECMSKNGVTAVIDFAHTPDALENALRSLSPLCRGRLITVFGCGGDRDVGKRPLMGGIAEKYSDKIYLTSDNPRSENPDVIISQIAAGIKNIEKTVHITNRKDAVMSALADARGGDVVLIAGKGHEAFTVDLRGKHKYSDKETVTEFFEKTQNEF
ncbi:MAG: UDP-N-acetylmuramoyl-L-alanyl-D-glutamate--2,6-diaminopimelate ligase, partial [Clostridiales bacterium]|nr:UDP-N-acetylmuramoyl-L-alanyl-D-glutamate--2,6-diaminopimelate ligase [Clostridiales bacterium]